ncbi:MAG TPA: hypothetical protein VEG30_00135 [Terriglobales bacterium]|nr:hypothetical protein [Terriglobales bacterium]
MRTEKELAAAIRAAMKRKKLEKNQLAQALKINPIMLDKIVCGDIVPSEHLEKQMIEVLGVKEVRVKKMADRRQRRPKPKNEKRPPERKRAA